MRKPKYLSPTAISMWDANRQEFYMNYLAEQRVDKIPQTLPMAIGSGFDALIKYDLNPAGGNLFDKQVEPQNHSVLEDCQHIFDAYRNTTLYKALKAELQTVTDADFEFKQERVVGGVPLLGKPDAYYRVAGVGVILDWKVNGYMSKSNVSPNKGFMFCEDMYTDRTHTRTHMTTHKAVLLSDFKGLTVTSCYFDEINTTWALQLAIYGWLMGETPGTPFIGQIDQIACSGAKRTVDGRPDMRLARYRSLIGCDYQQRLVEKIKVIWKSIELGHIFTDMSYEDNLLKINELERMAATYVEGTPEDKFIYRSQR
jgi:hypothetical protein